eukprot:1108391-Prymnesium_polylepis.1
MRNRPRNCGKCSTCLRLSTHAKPRRDSTDTARAGGRFLLSGVPLGTRRNLGRGRAEDEFERTSTRCEAPIAFYASWRYMYANVRQTTEAKYRASTSYWSVGGAAQNVPGQSAA